MSDDPSDLAEDELRIEVDIPQGKTNGWWLGQHAQGIGKQIKARLKKGATIRAATMRVSVFLDPPEVDDV